MGAFAALCQYYNRPLFEIAQDLAYSPSNIHILEGKEAILKEKYPDVYSNLLSCTHNKDNRTIIEYAQDLVASWIFEDTLIIDLQNSGLDIKKSGADKYRKILPNSKVSAASDTKISVNNKEIHMEIMCDYTGFWAREKKADLRDEKYNKLKKEEALFLGFDISNKQYLLIDFTQPVEARYTPSHFPYGGKPAYSINLKNQHALLPIDLHEIVEQIVFLARER